MPRLAGSFRLALAACAAACSSGSPAPPRQPPPDASSASPIAPLSPDWGSSMSAPIAPHDFGHNAVWSRGGLGLWDEGAGAPQPEVRALVAALRPGVLRFPGGTRAMRYKFEQAIGPLAQRQPQCDTFTGATDATSYGLDEFLGLAAGLGSQVTLVASWVDGSPQRTAAMVAYVNGDPASTVALGVDGDGMDWGVAGDWARKRAAWGHPSPWGVAMLEVGNEPYLDLATGPPVSCGRPGQFKQDERWVAGKAIPTTAKDYAAQLVATAALVRAIDPSLRIGACAYSSYDGVSNAAMEAGDVDRASGGDAWDARLLSDAPSAFDVFVLHPYDLTFGASRVGLAGRLGKTIADLSALAPSKPVAVTEFGTFAGGGSLLNVVLSADVVRVGILANAAMVLRHILIEDDPGEPFANSAAILGAAHAKEPGYAVMQLLATTLSGRAVPTPEVLPDLEAMAAWTSGAGVAVLLLDRRAAASGPTDIDVALPAGSFRGALHVLSAASLASTAVTRVDTIVTASGKIRVTLPANGVAVVTLATGGP